MVPTRAILSAPRGFHMSSSPGPLQEDALSKQSHWYRLTDGESCHSVPQKSNPTKRRSPSLNDAKSLRLVPSVTTVLSIVHSQSLQAWGLREMMFAAWRLVVEREGPRKQSDLVKRQQSAEDEVGKAELVEDEAGIRLEDIDADYIAAEVEFEVRQSRSWDLKVFLTRVTKMYIDKISEAPNKGKAFHEVVENHLILLLKGQQPLPWPEKYQPYQAIFTEWMVIFLLLFSRAASLSHPPTHFLSFFFFFFLSLFLSWAG